MTVKNVSLTPDTRFLVFLQGAKSTTGDLLDRPYAITFSTGGNLPTATVSGTINFPGGVPGGTAIGLFIEPPFGPGGGEEEEEGGGDLEAAAVIPLSSSNYTINYVSAGTYFILAFKDMNQDGMFDFRDDAFGGYDTDADNIIDQITIAEGENLPNIDLTASLPTVSKARENFAAAKNIAQSLLPGYALTIVVSDAIALNGEASVWNYGFYAANQDTVLFVGLIGDLFFTMPLPINSTGGDDGGPRLNIPLPENWLDSDVAVDSAEANGGSDFRNMYPDAEITAMASAFLMPGNGGSILAKSAQIPYKTAWSSGTPFEKYRPDGSLTQMTADDTLAAWIFIYSSKMAEQPEMIFLDAETGRPVDIPGPGGQPTKALAKLDAANAAALNWQPDAELVHVRNFESVAADGFAPGWVFAYYSSADKDSVHAFFMLEGMVIDERVASIDNVFSVEALPADWLDSPAVSPVAEANSNNFRNAHPDAFVEAILSRNVLPYDTSRAVWLFMYDSQADDVRLSVNVDALTGDVIVAVEENPESAIMPESISLEQNYPNPFNPETVIKYQLPQNGQVELTVFNLLGQQVRQLVSAVKRAGAHEVRWDGLDDFGESVTSGVYIYRLKAGEFSRTRKMILLR